MEFPLFGYHILSLAGNSQAQRQITRLTSQKHNNFIALTSRNTNQRQSGTSHGNLLYSGNFVFETKVDVIWQLKLFSFCQIKKGKVTYFNSHNTNLESIPKDTTDATLLAVQFFNSRKIRRRLRQFGQDVTFLVPPFAIWFGRSSCAIGFTFAYDCRLMFNLLINQQLIQFSLPQSNLSAVLFTSLIAC
jgi:hypothetical protein